MEKQLSNTRVFNYEQEDPKKHSVRFKPETPEDNFAGVIYVARKSGLADAKRLRITVEEV